MLFASKLKIGLTLMLAVLLLLCFVILFLYLLFVGPIFWISGDPVSARPPGLPTSELLLSETPFPDGWQIDPPSERDISPSQSSRTLGRIGISGNVLQDVFYYRTEKDAAAKFQRYKETEPDTFTAPTEIDYRSPIADEQYLYCGADHRNITGCVAARRYGNYFIYFYFDLDQGYNDGLSSIEEVEPILQALDELVAERLSIPLSIEEANP